MYFLEIRLLTVPANSSCVPYIAGVPNTTQEIEGRLVSKTKRNTGIVQVVYLRPVVILMTKLLHQEIIASLESLLVNDHPSTRALVICIEVPVMKNNT